MKTICASKRMGFFALVSVLLSTACQKNTSATSSATTSGNIERASGAIPDDIAAIRKVPVLISSTLADIPAIETNKTRKGGGTGATTPTPTPTPVGTDTTTTVINPPATLPSSVQLSMPPVGNQGSQSSCVAFTVAYAARSCEQYYRTGAASYSYSTNIFSPAYLYDLTKASTSCSSGSSLLNALNYVYNYGVCRWQTLPYNASGCSLTPTATETAEAANYKIPTYSRMYTSDSTGIRTMLAAKHPLMVSFTADANFYYAGPGYIWNSYSSTLYGPHSVALCGYDNSKHAYLAINSWGTSWGTNGYIWIDYNFLTTISYDLYVMN